MLKKRFVKFYWPGFFIAEESEENELSSTKFGDYNDDVNEALCYLSEYKTKPYGFRIYTRGRKDEEFDSRILDNSGMYYINGIVKTLEEVKLDPDATTILISNMISNKWDRVAKIGRWFQPFFEDDHVIDDSGNVIV